MVKILIKDALAKEIAPPENQMICPKCKKGLLVRRQNKVKGTYFGGCNRYPECKGVFSEKNGQPDL